MARGFHLTQPVSRAARISPDCLATIDGDRQLTHREFRDNVQRLAGGLLELGVRSGDRVSALALNSDRFLLHYQAAWWIGAITAPLNIRWSTDEIIYSLNDVETSVLLVDRSFADRVDTIRAECPSIRAVISMDGSDVHDSTTMLDLMNDGPPVPDAGFGGQDPACILFSGGTTGYPKGALLSHDSIVCGGVGMRTMGCGTSELLLHCAPLFHMGGIQMASGHWFGNGTHVLVPGFVPAVVAEAVERHGVTDMLLAPTMLAMLLNDPHSADRDLSSLRQLVYGTAPINPSLLKQAMDAMPHVKFMQGYGMTETAMTLMLPPDVHRPDSPLNSKLGATGVASPFTEFKIVDASDTEVPSGEVGELAVRTPGLMLGYWNRDDETSETIRNGWLYTGDAAYADADGYVYVVDRIKDMILTGGENVFSIEVERALARHEDVDAVAVIGLPDPTWGERVHAVVVPRTGTQPRAEDLISYARETLAGYKVPRTIEFVDTLPLSAANKILKKELRMRHALS